MDPLTIGTVIAGAKTGLEVIKQAADAVTSVRSAMKAQDGKVPPDVDAKLAELSDHLIVARVRTIDTLSLAEQLQAENIALRNELARKAKFSERARLYSLKQFKDGSVAYEYTPERGDQSPVHLACPQCFEDEKIRLLQPSVVDFGETKMSCNACGTAVLITNGLRFSAPQVISDYDPFSND